MTFSKFVIVYSSIIFLLFRLHIFFLDPLKVNAYLIHKSYIFFYFFSIFFYLFIYLRTKKNAHIATIFLSGTTIKLIVFFLIFRPIILQDNFINKFEISIFLIPYIFSSAFIIFFISKLMANPN